MSVGPPPFSGKELPAVIFDVNHVYVLSRPRWTRCMSRTAAACSLRTPTKMALSGTHEHDVGCISGAENACHGFGSSLQAHPM